jgi:hypothetical protein
MKIEKTNKIYENTHELTENLGPEVVTENI